MLFSKRSIARRDFLKGVGAGAAGIVLGSSSQSMGRRRARNGKPNIVLVIADDMAWHLCGPYGEKEIKTPNMDKLAAQGMTFDKAFTATAMCAPTR